jgi:hypothetical protein
MPRVIDHCETLPTAALAAVVETRACGSTSGHSLFTGVEALLLMCP